MCMSERRACVYARERCGSIVSHTNIYNFLSFSFAVFFLFYAHGAINFPSINFHFLFSAVYPRIIFCSPVGSLDFWNGPSLLPFRPAVSSLSFNLTFSGWICQRVCECVRTPCWSVYTYAVPWRQRYHDHGNRGRLAWGWGAGWTRTRVRVCVCATMVKRTFNKNKKAAR